MEQGGQPADQGTPGPGPRTAMAFGGGPDGSAATRSQHGGRAGGTGQAAGASPGHGPADGEGGRGRTGRAGKNDRSRRSASSAESDARWRSLDKTGNVRLLSAEDLALEFPDQVTPPPPSPRAMPPAAPPTPATLTFTDTSLAAPEPAAEPATPDYAVPDYAAASDVASPEGTAVDAADVADSPDVTSAEAWADTYASVQPYPAGDDLSPAAPAADAIVTAPDLAGADDPTIDGPTEAELADAELAGAGPAEAELAAPPAELPVPNYDGLSLPSLRARLRGLDVPQLRTLVDYERANAARADVITMFERRIEKLTAGQ